MADYLTAKGFLTEGERLAIYDIARGFPEGKFINIGVEYGASLFCMRQGAPRASILGVDIDISKVVGAYKVSLREINSKELLVEWDGTMVDFVFVDGDHSYEGVKADTGWSKFVEVGGYIAYHDCYDWPPSPPKTVHQICPGVNKAVQEWKDRVRSDYEELEHVDTMRIFKRSV